MAGSKQAKRKDGGRSDKKSAAKKQDVAARRAGNEAARPKAKAGAPKAARAGRQGNKRPAGPATHKEFSAGSMATGNERRGGRGGGSQGKTGTDR